MQNGSLSLSHPHNITNSSVPTLMAQNLTSPGCQHNSEEKSRSLAKINDEMNQRATNVGYGLGHWLRTLFDWLYALFSRESKEESSSIVPSDNSEELSSQTIASNDRVEEPSSTLIVKPREDTHRDDSKGEGNLNFLAKLYAKLYPSPETSLHLAARKGTYEELREFYFRDDNCDAQNADGDTPLHLATLRSNDEMVVLLLNKADPSIPNNQGQTARMLATDYPIRCYIERQIITNAIKKGLRKQEDFTSGVHDPKQGDIFGLLEKDLYAARSKNKDGVFNSYKGIRSSDAKNTRTPEATEKPSIKP